MSATSGRDKILSGELQSDLDAKGFKVKNADLSDNSNTFPAGSNPSIAHTSGVLKGDNSGNAVGAIAKTDFWDGTVFVASGGSHAKGLVPDPGASAATTHYLREDGTWAIPPGTTSVPTIASTTGVLKGDNAGNAVAGTAKTDFWDTTTVVNGGSHTKGLAPDPGSGSGTTKYLREDGTWAVPPAASGVVIASTNNVIKGDNAGGGIAATPGTDYVVPSTALTRLTASSVAITGAAPAINWATTTSFTFTLSVNTVPTFSNATDGWDITVFVTNTGSNYTVTWPMGIKWQGGTQPTQTIGAKTDVWTFKQAGSTIYGSVNPNHS